MEFSRQDYWCGLPLPSQGIFLTQGSNPGLLHWQADSLPLNHQRSPQSPQSNMTSENNSPPTQILSANGKESVCTQPSNKASNLSKTKNAKKYIFWNGEKLDLELCGFYISHHWILYREMLLCKGKYKKEAPPTGTQPSGKSSFNHLIKAGLLYGKIKC